jgi:hypothetical protein
MNRNVTFGHRLSLLVTALLLLAAAAAFADEMSVTVKQTPVRDKPSFLGKTLGILSYADRVTVLDQSVKGWVRVKGPDGKLQGWVSASALQTRKIVLAAGSENVEQGASSGEVALAGKGFSEEVENKYKQEGNIDYTWVDKMETYNPPTDQVAAFLQQGGLNTTGGAQ